MERNTGKDSRLRGVGGAARGWAALVVAVAVACGAAGGTAWAQETAPTPPEVTGRPVYGPEPPPAEGTLEGEAAARREADEETRRAAAEAAHQNALEAAGAAQSEVERQLDAERAQRQEL